jgi:hypothetical protein
VTSGNLIPVCADGAVFLPITIRDREHRGRSVLKRCVQSKPIIHRAVLKNGAQVEEQAQVGVLLGARGGRQTGYDIRKGNFHIAASFQFKMQVIRANIFLLYAVYFKLKISPFMLFRPKGRFRCIMAS